MARTEVYTWSLLTEVGDYFGVPESFKPFSYVSRLVAQQNYRFDDKKYAVIKTSYGSIVMLAQINEEIPPHEFTTPQGIFCSTSRQHLIAERAQAQARDPNLGAKPIVAKRTQSQIIDSMHWQVRNENLPWWYDPVKGNLVVNPKRIKEPESTMWMNKKFNPGKETPYPEHYNLDENFLIREEPEEDEEDFSEDGMPIIGDTGDDVDLNDE